MTDDPLSEIENEKAMRDMGAFMHRIYQGALTDGASRVEAFWLVVAWVVGQFKQSELPKPEEDE